MIWAGVDLRRHVNLYQLGFCEMCSTIKMQIGGVTDCLVLMYPKMKSPP